MYTVVQITLPENYLYITVIFALVIRCHCSLRKRLYRLCLANFSLSFTSYIRIQSSLFRSRSLGLDTVNLVLNVCSCESACQLYVR